MRGIYCLCYYLVILQKLFKQILNFTEKGQKNRKYPVSGSVDGNALLMSEVRGEWSDWLEMIERQQ